MSVTTIMSGVMKPLDTRLGRGQQVPVVEPDADVAVVGRHVPARVHTPADFTDLGAELFFAGRHGVAVMAAVRTGSARAQRDRAACAS